MGWLRLRRYKAVFRLGVVTYFLILLGLTAGWTYFYRHFSSAWGPVVEDNGHYPGHHHVRIQDIAPRDDDIFVLRGTRDPHVRPPVFSRVSYPSNHSHPVKDVPPEADRLPSGAKGPSGSCSVVRQVEFFGQSLRLEGEPLCSWLTKPKVLADHRLVLYGDKMALLYDVTVDPAALGPGPRGGERMEKVWGQSEAAEYLKLKEGFFSLQCRTKPAVKFGTKDHLKHWFSALRCGTNSSGPTAGVVVPGLTIAVQRYEYVNLYHTITDFFNAFLAMLMFNQHPDHVTILWVDAHPRGGLDDTWSTLFGPVMRTARLPAPTRFSALAWAAMGYNSPVNQHSAPALDYAEEFRHFFLSRHGVAGGRTLNCSSLSWLLVWRRDYAAHPRNKGGSISRKIHNEDEAQAAVRGVVPARDTVRGLQLDSLPMQTQLELIAETDVLVGMHGAGLSHTLFLPSHGGLLELYPTYWPQNNRHFRSMAAWRGLHYLNWQNHDSRNEKANRRTYIPPHVIVKMAQVMRRNMCG